MVPNCERVCRLLAYDGAILPWAAACACECSGTPMDGIVVDDSVTFADDVLR